MPICGRCETAFPNHAVVDGKARNLSRRRYCLTCSPFGANNSRRLSEWDRLPVLGEEKRCGSCKEIKPVEDFYHDSSQEDGLSWRCAECNRRRDKAYRDTHKERHAASRQAYYRAHVAAISAKTKQWQERNPELFAYYCRKSSAKQRNIPWELDKGWYVEHIWNHQCSYGPHSANGGIDRLDSNGIYEPANCVPCCWWCNTIKGTHTVEEMRSHLAEMLDHPLPEPPAQLSFDWLN